MVPKTLCQTGKRSCIGCCGHSYSAAAKVRKGIEANTVRWRKASEKGAIEGFRKEAKTLLQCGICRAVISEGGRIFCALHPAHIGSDMRDEDCEKEYLCKAMKYYIGWDNAARKRFLNFIESKDPDWFAYSMGLDSNSYIEEFLRRE